MLSQCGLSQMVAFIVSVSLDFQEIVFIFSMVTRYFLLTLYLYHSQLIVLIATTNKHNCHFVSDITPANKRHRT